MKSFFSNLTFLFVRLLLALRYRIQVDGLESLKTKGGILFLANHPAEIDPLILTTILWKKFKPRPVALDTLFQGALLRKILNFSKALPIPTFDASSNSFKRRQIELTYEKIFKALGNKENILIYPAGGLKNGPEEVVGGASGIHRILTTMENVDVVLVRTTGLWGSSFSKAITGKTPELKGAFLHGAKVVLKNLLFFTPKRKVLIEISKAPQGFPLRGTRLELNRALEKWYNARGPEPLNLVSYAFWKREVPQISKVQKSKAEIVGNIPDDVKVKVLTELGRLSMRNVSEMKGEENLSLELGLDSLDQAQLVLFIKETFGLSGIRSADLVTVGDVMAYAAGLLKPEQEEEEEGKKDFESWVREERRKAPIFPEGKTLLEAFLNSAERMDGLIACADGTSGQVSYTKLKLSVIMLAKRIQKMRGDHIGIMLPASVAANAAILATLLAGKTPVMINWTLGSRNLKAILEDAKIKTTISSWRFLDRLENFELDGFDENILLLEHMRASFTLGEKIRALRLLQKKPKSLLRTFGLEHQTEENLGVILYTSGTENLPKGVPLSHKNILSNLRDAFELVSFTSNDVVLSVLPPFHSFGFSVTGIFPLLIGMRAMYLPNPTDGRRMAGAIERWDATLLCIAPSFFKNLIRVASPKQLETLQLVVLGAEKASPEIYEKMRELNPQTIVAEGYGVTECSPILTMNPPLGKKKGVGVAFRSVELIAVHPETHEKLPRNSDGLILARGPNLFRGYLDPTLKSPFMEVDGKKWYVTGDLGSIDENGYLTLSGRLKRFVKIGGEMISLGAIEDIMVDAGQKMHWKMDPEKPSLAVIAKEDQGKKAEIALFTTFPLTLEEANSELRKQGMSNLVRLSKTQQLPFIPLLGTGKIDYRTLEGKWGSNS